MTDPAKEKSAPEPKPRRKVSAAVSGGLVAHDSGPQDPTKGGDKKDT